MADEVPPRRSGDPWEPPPPAGSSGPPPEPPPGAAASSSTDPDDVERRPGKEDPAAVPAGKEDPAIVPAGDERAAAPAGDDPAAVPVGDDPAARFDDTAPRGGDEPTAAGGEPTATAPASDDVTRTPPAGDDATRTAWIGDEPTAAVPAGAAPPAPGTEGFGAAPGEVGATPVAPAKRSKLPMILGIVAVVLLVVCGLGAFGIYSMLSRDGASDAKQGSCLAGDKINQASDQSQEVEIWVVECDDAGVNYKVAGRVEDKLETEATNDVCLPFDDADFVYWEGRKGEKGFVLCLSTVGTGAEPTPS